MVLAKHLNNIQSVLVKVPIERWALNESERVLFEVNLSIQKLGNGENVDTIY